MLSVDRAGSYYQIKNRERGLDKRIRQLIEKRSKKIPPTYERLARLLKLIQDRPDEWEDADALQLIVTTNFDLLMECALLLEGICFTRLVQHRSGECIQVDTFTQVPHEKRMEEVEGDLATWLGKHCQTEKFDRPGDLVSLSLDRYPEPFLYKFHGSIDVDKSCLISCEQYLRFVNGRSRQECIPDRIRDIIINTSSLILGYEMLDADFQLTYHIFHEAFADSDIDNYALVCQPEDVEAGLWEDMKHAAMKKNIAVLEGDDDQLGFIDKLIDQVKALTGGVS